MLEEAHVSLWLTGLPMTNLRDRLQTVQLVPMTAFDEEGRIHFAPMQALLERSFAAGVRVFIPCAGSAEFDSLSEAEIVATIRMARDALGSDAVIIAPIGRQLHAAIELGRNCRDAGADACLAMPLAPTYLSNAGASDYYRAILDFLDCPLLIYKKAEIPSDKLLLDLANHPRMIGVKYAVNDLDAFTSTCRRDTHGLHWSCGSAERFAPFFLLAGATGYTTGAGNLCPRLTLALHAAARRGDWPEAMRLRELIVPIEHYRAREGSSYNVSMLKHALYHCGHDFGRPRPPQRRLTGKEQHEIELMLEPILKAERELELAAREGADVKTQQPKSM